MRIVILKEDGTPDKTAMAKERVKETLTKVADGTKKFLSGAWQFCKDNKEELIVLVPLGLAAAKGVKNLATPSVDRGSERYRIDHTYYDPSTGAHWQLRRSLNNRERAELMQRRRSGEYTEDILDDMGVLR